MSENQQILPDMKLVIRTTWGHLIYICYEDAELCRTDLPRKEEFKVRKRATGFTVSSTSSPTHIITVGQKRILKNIEFSVEKIVR